MAAGDLNVAHDLIIVGDSTLPKIKGVTDTDVVTNLNADQVDGADKDTDTALAANSDAKVPSQKAVKTYIDTKDAQNVKLTGAQTIAGLKYFDDGFRVENRTDDPGSPQVGQVWFRTDF